MCLVRRHGPFGPSLGIGCAQQVLVEHRVRDVLAIAIGIDRMALLIENVVSTGSRAVFGGEVRDGSSVVVAQVRDGST